MTKNELNRDIKRLYAKISRLSNGNNNDAYYHYLQNQGQKEFERLYWASDDFSLLTKQSILILLVLNRRHRFMAFHNFGNKIEL